MQHATISSQRIRPQVVNQTAPQVVYRCSTDNKQSVVTNANPETNAIVPERTVVLPSSPASTK
jgi:hypothetical protein